MSTRIILQSSLKIKLLACSIVLLFANCSTAPSKFINAENSLYQNWDNLKHENLAYVFVISEYDCGSCVSHIPDWLNTSFANKGQAKYFGLYYKEPGAPTFAYKDQLAATKDNIDWKEYNDLKFVTELATLTNGANGPFIVKVSEGRVVGVEHFTYQTDKYF